MSSFVFCSPAKVNLQLSLLFKRADGYHEIETLMHTISLADRLTFLKTDKSGIRFSCTDPRLPVDESNLVIKAANAFQEATSISLSIDAHLEKHIPFGAGLGGGSSNAATTLYALNALYNTKLSSQELQTLAAKIGSDIPFFFSKEGAAICRGRGEIIEDTAPMEENFFLFTPPYTLFTPSVYEKFADTFKRRICYKIGQFPCNALWNDLEPAAFFLSPELKKQRDLLQKSGFTVLMSGSGSSLLLFGEGRLPSSLAPFYRKVSLRQKRIDSWY